MSIHQLIGEHPVAAVLVHGLLILAVLAMLRGGKVAESYEPKSGEGKVEL